MSVRRNRRPPLHGESHRDCDCEGDSSSRHLVTRTFRRGRHSQMCRAEMLASALLCLAALTGSASALTCYVCSSVAGINVGGSCSDPFSASNATTSNNLTVCTSCGKFYMSVSNSSISSISPYARTCEVTNQTAGCQTLSILSVSIKSCYCLTDLCNGAEQQAYNNTIQQAYNNTVQKAYNGAVLQAASTGSMLAVCALAVVRFAL